MYHGHTVAVSGMQPNMLFCIMSTSTSVRACDRQLSSCLITLNSLLVAYGGELQSVLRMRAFSSRPCSDTVSAHTCHSHSRLAFSHAASMPLSKPLVSRPYARALVSLVGACSSGTATIGRSVHNIVPGSTHVRVASGPLTRSTAWRPRAALDSNDKPSPPASALSRSSAQLAHSGACHGRQSAR